MSRIQNCPLCVNNPKLHHSSKNIQDLITYFQIPKKSQTVLQELSIKAGAILTCKMQHNKNALFFQQCQTVISNNAKYLGQSNIESNSLKK